MNRMPTSALAALALATAPWVAQAGKATVQATDDSGNSMNMDFEYRGDSQLRMSVPQQQGGYMLVDGDAVYSISQHNGQPMVMRLDKLLGSGMPAPATPGADVAGVSKLENTGRTETVAGIQGEVWMLTYTDAAGQTRTDEIVVSDDPRAVELSRAMMGLGQAMAKAAGQPAQDDPLIRQLEGKGMLRMGSQMRVTALSDADPAADRFALPAEPTEMPGMGALGGLFGKQTDRQQQRTESRAQSETNNAVDGAVDKVLDKAFSIFD